jgi:hypothetical protein
VVVLVVAAVVDVDVRAVVVVVGLVVVGLLAVVLVDDADFFGLPPELQPAAITPLSAMMPITANVCA